MAIQYTETGDQRWRFKSKHWTHTRTNDNQELITISGIVIIDFKGVTYRRWKRDRLELYIHNPVRFPSGKALQINQWAPFITINAIYNRNEANCAGWAVDEFGGPGRSQILSGGIIPIWANIAVRDSDGWLFRVSYEITIVGALVDYEPIVE